MADFRKALEHVLRNEGGYVNDPDDPGGETYKGIARKMNPQWKGWPLIDKRDFSNPMLEKLVSDFYRDNYWTPIKGDSISSQDVATSIFDFGINAGVKTSAALAQSVVGAEIDGAIGSDSISAINAFDEEHFIAAFTVVKIARYVLICKKRPTSKKYFFGWVCRALGE